MLKFDKQIQTKTTEIITIQPGVYFFKEVIDAEIYYRKYVVREDDWEGITVICSVNIKRHHFETDDLPNWAMERCFAKDDGVQVIEEKDFVYKEQEFQRYYDEYYAVK